MAIRKAKTAKESFVSTVPTLSLMILKMCKDTTEEHIH